MGYMRHNAIIVTCYSTERIIEAHQKAVEIIGGLVSPITRSNINGYQSFFVAPDGSKEGWEISDDADAKRELLTKWLDEQRFEDNSNSFDWVEVQYGDDGYETKIIKDSHFHIRKEINST